MISSKEHGYLDYLYGVILLVMPWVLNFSSGVMTIMSTTIGIILLFQSLFTNYELGLVKIIPFKIHLGIDVLAGMFLIISPWLFNFSDSNILAFIAVGLFAVIVSFFTSTKKPKKRKKVKRKFPNNEFIDPKHKEPTSNEMKESLNSEG